MLLPQIIDLWPCLDLPDTVLSDVIEDAQDAARDPSKTLLDCPYNWCAPTDRFWRACRAAWRFAFREMRERLDARLVALRERQAA